MYGPQRVLYPMKRVGERGALQCYGTPNSPEFNYDRT